MAHSHRPRAGFFANMMAPANTYPLIRTSIFRDGNRAAAAYIFVAVLLNHIRRLLTPWLGQFLWHHAISNMKLARSSPHYFLQRSMEYDWWTVIGWAMQAYAVSLCRRALAHEIAGEQRSIELQEERSKQAAGSEEKIKKKSHDMVRDIKRVIYLWLVLMDMERSYTEACWAGAHVFAIYKILLRDSPAERLFSMSLLIRRLDRVPLLAGLFWRWLYVTTLSSAVQVVRAARRGSLAPLLVYGVVWYGTAYLVRYSNKYFVLLEMSDMWVTFGWMGVGVVYILAVMVGAS